MGWFLHRISLNVDSNYMISQVMKTIALVLLLTGCKTDGSLRPHGENTIETLTINNDFVDQIDLLTDSSVEVGVFNKAVFRKDNQIVFEIYDEDSYDTIDSVLKGFTNEIESKHILIQKLEGKYFIGLWGAQYGCCPRRLTLIQADADGVRTVFKDEFEVNQIQMNEKGELKYFGITSFSESLYAVDSLDILLFTYNPTLVYDLKSGFKLDSALTRKYNEEHYVFAGFSYDGDLSVAFPKDEDERKRGTRKPYIFK